MKPLLLLSDAHGTVYATGFVMGNVPFLDVTVLGNGVPFYPYHMEMTVYDRHYRRRPGEPERRAIIISWDGVTLWRGTEWPAA